MKQVKIESLKDISLLCEGSVVVSIFINNPKHLTFLPHPTVDECNKSALRVIAKLNKLFVIKLGKNLRIERKINLIPAENFALPDIMKPDYIIGSGGFGIIYKNILNNTPVAIKFIKNSKLEYNSLKKIVKEYKIIKKLDHENIIKSFGIVKVNSHHGIILEQCMNGSLNTINRNLVKSNIRKILEIMLKVIRGVEYMHMKNICHFDIKPQNILLNCSFEPKLIDLGLSQNEPKKIKLNTGFTLIYCSPEQIKGRGVSKKSDIWSYGMTFYNVLTGLSPFNYLSENAKIKLDKDKFYDDICSNKRLPMIPEDLKIKHPAIVKLLEDMWKIDPEARPSAREVRQMLTKIIIDLV